MSARDAYRLKGAGLVPVWLLISAVVLIGCGEAVTYESSIGGGGGGAASLMLNWTAPSTNEDGSPLEDLAGFKLYYGPASGQYTDVVIVGNFTTAEIADLDPGTYFVAVTAYDIYGNESAFSNEVNHTFN